MSMTVYQSLLENELQEPSLFTFITDKTLCKSLYTHSNNKHKQHLQISFALLEKWTHKYVQIFTQKHFGSYLLLIRVWSTELNLLTFLSAFEEPGALCTSDPSPKCFFKVHSLSLQKDQLVWRNWFLKSSSTQNDKQTLTMSNDHVQTTLLQITLPLKTIQEGRLSPDL